MSLFLRFYNWVKKKYIKLYYKDKLPEITYDESLHGFMHPYFFDHDEFFDVELLAEKLCNEYLCYEFQIGGEYDCRNEFHRVIEDAYNYGSQFTIPPECESDYSQQELALLRKLAWQGEIDRQKYKIEHDLPCITMTTEEDSEEDEISSPVDYCNDNAEDYSWKDF